MSESHLMGFLVLFLSVLPTESTFGILDSIDDLKKIPFGQSVPKHSLVLLHWFANTIEIDNNDAIELTFEPNHGDYGTHHYGNFERFLDPVPFGHRYYTLGNINPGLLLFIVINERNLPCRPSRAREPKRSPKRLGQ
ncbi:unnamed protein product [Arctogadus glacialis]